jgi:hypothetical protein
MNILSLRKTYHTSSTFIIDGKFNLYEYDAHKERGNTRVYISYIDVQSRLPNQSILRGTCNVDNRSTSHVIFDDDGLIEETHSKKIIDAGSKLMDLDNVYDTIIYNVDSVKKTTLYKRENVFVNDKNMMLKRITYYDPLGFVSLDIIKNLDEEMMGVDIIYERSYLFGIPRSIFFKDVNINFSCLDHFKKGVNVIDGLSLFLKNGDKKLLTNDVKGTRPNSKDKIKDLDFIKTLYIYFYNEKTFILNSLKHLYYDGPNNESFTLLKKDRINIKTNIDRYKGYDTKDIGNIYDIIFDKDGCVTYKTIEYHHNKNYSNDVKNNSLTNTILVDYQKCTTLRKEHNFKFKTIDKDYHGDIKYSNENKVYAMTEINDNLNITVVFDTGMEFINSLMIFPSVPKNMKKNKKRDNNECIVHMNFMLIYHEHFHTDSTGEMLYGQENVIYFKTNCVIDKKTKEILYKNIREKLSLFKDIDRSEKSNIIRFYKRCEECKKIIIEHNRIIGKYIASLISTSTIYDSLFDI